MTRQEQETRQENTIKTIKRRGQDNHMTITRQDRTRQENHKTIKRQDKTRQDKTRQDKTRQDKTRQDKDLFCPSFVLPATPLVRNRFIG